MTRVEALLLGGAAEWDGFPAQLAKLRGPLTAQVADRRSSIVRQAAHLLVILSAELGGEFEKEAAHFVPELFKCVVITVQIIAESGDHGIRGVLHNCQARQLVPRLCEAASRTAGQAAVPRHGLAQGHRQGVGRAGRRAEPGVRRGGAQGDGGGRGRRDVRRLGVSPFSRRTARGTPRAPRASPAGWTPTPSASSRARRLPACTTTTSAGSAPRRRCARGRPRTAATKARPGPTETREFDRPSTVAASGGRRAGVEASRDSGLGVARVGGGAERASARAATTSGVAERANRVGSVGGMATTASRAAAAAARRASAIGGVSDVSGTLASGASGGRSRAPNAATTRERSLGATEATEGAVPLAPPPLARSARAPRGRSAEPEKAEPAIGGGDSFVSVSVSSALDAAPALRARGSPLHGSGRRAHATASWEAKTAAFDARRRAARGGACASEASSRARELADAFVARGRPAPPRRARRARGGGGGCSWRRRALEPELERLCPPLFPRLVDSARACGRLASAARFRRGGRRLPRGRHPALAARVAGGGARAARQDGRARVRAVRARGRAAARPRRRDGVGAGAPAGSAALRRTGRARRAACVRQARAPARGGGGGAGRRARARGPRRGAQTPRRHAARRGGGDVSRRGAARPRRRARVPRLRRRRARARRSAPPPKRRRSTRRRAHAISGSNPRRRASPRRKRGRRASLSRRSARRLLRRRRRRSAAAAAEEKARWWRRRAASAIPQRREEEAARRSADEVAVFEEREDSPRRRKIGWKCRKSGEARRSFRTGWTGWTGRTRRFRFRIRSRSSTRARGGRRRRKARVSRVLDTREAARDGVRGGPRVSRVARRR